MFTFDILTGLLANITSLLEFSAEKVFNELKATYSHLKGSFGKMSVSIILLEQEDALCFQEVSDHCHVRKHVTVSSANSVKWRRDRTFFFPISIRSVLLLWIHANF